MSAPAAAPPPRSLPPLSFLDGHGLLIHDPESLNARIRQHLPMPASVTPATARGFFHKSVIVGLGSLTLSDSLHGALTFTAGESDDVTLGLCHAGGARLTVDGRELTLDQAHGAVYLPGGGFQARTGAFHDTLLTLPRARLATCAATISGLGSSPPQLGRRLDAPLLFDPGDRRRRELLVTLRRSLKLVDAPSLQSQGGLPLLHLDDLFVRLLTLLLWPELLEEWGSDRPWLLPGEPNRAFADLLEWIRAHLHRPITLSELEQRSSYSRRSLQYLFRRRFDCTPLQWVKRQRLEAVRRDLLKAQPGDTVSRIARRHGLHDLSACAEAFRREFGLTPSQLLREPGRPR